MSSLLFVTSSILGQHSKTLELGRELVANLRGAKVITRELTVENSPHLSFETIGALGKPTQDRTTDEQARVDYADGVIAQVEAADTIVIAAPMYNFSIPSTLKAWIDHLARAGRTFRYSETGPVGLLTGKKVYVVSARGGLHAGQPSDIVEPYLRVVLGFLGLTDITFVNAEGLAMGAEPAAKGLAAARTAIADLAQLAAAA